MHLLMSVKSNIILASGSPRRQKFLTELGIPFEIKLKAIDEKYPLDLTGSDITDYLARLKAQPFANSLSSNDVLVTADTIVWHNHQALGKPTNKTEAIQMLQSLSGQTHEVISSFCLTTVGHQIVKNQTTKVYFKTLTNNEIEYYVEHYKPYDKAGSYGIQEWIGYIAIEKIEGCFYNVMGFPIKLFYEELIRRNLL